jgi:hypothetical protein
VTFKFEIGVIVREIFERTAHAEVEAQTIEQAAGILKMKMEVMSADIAELLPDIFCEPRYEQPDDREVSFIGWDRDGEAFTVEPMRDQRKHLRTWRLSQQGKVAVLYQGKHYALEIMAGYARDEVHTRNLTAFANEAAAIKWAEGVLEEGRPVWEQIEPRRPLLSWQPASDSTDATS